MYVSLLLLALFCSVTQSWLAKTTTARPQTRIYKARHTEIQHVCHDKLGYDKCRSYGMASCGQIYEAWARENCAEYCGYCNNPDHTIKACVDTLTTCASYPPEICTDDDYRIWTEDHCCAFCKGDRNRPTTARPYISPTLPAGECANRIDCDVYEDSACVGVYAPWASQKCPLRCGYCANQTEPCFNRIDYCNQYTADVCKLPIYRIWARRNCRQYCNVCYNQTNVITPGTGAYVEPTVLPVQKTTVPPFTGSTITPTSGPGAIIGSQEMYLVEGPPAAIPERCLYKGNNYKLNERWNDGCDYVCSCFDTITNRMICTNRCSNWSIYRPITKCKLVQEPGECCKRLECKAQ